jgi:CheY-like chemotaxis protein
MKTILVLEDELSLMMLLRHMLKDFSLIEATSAEQALGLFLNRDRQIDLLVADVTLPTSSGIQLALLLRSVVRALPVILMSGYPMSCWSDRDASDLQRLGSTSVAVLSKPFQSQDLLGMVCEVIRAPQSTAASAA